MDWYTKLDKQAADYRPQLRMICQEPMSRHTSVSYTHLDVYKRQVMVTVLPESSTAPESHTALVPQSAIETAASAS